MFKLLYDACRTENDAEKRIPQIQMAYLWAKRFHDEGLNRLRIDLEYTDKQMYTKKYVLV
jgi:hypothetical protein